MNSYEVYIYILIMALATYIVRALPMTVIRGEIKNPFMKSFLHYV
ncbi:MAG: AzlD domain-containing protein, partial [Candidatus Riflebacteria bacterium]|nr:AzlD domain-containing protein [Candidatus Riflebacteria bacterium]